MRAGGSRVSLLGRRPRPGFAVRVVRIAPGERVPYRPDDWLDSMVVVEAGSIELDGVAARVGFSAGSVLYLAGLTLAAIGNPGRRPAVLSAVSRDRGPAHSQGAHDV